jgi:hypothetical protein
MEKIDMTPTWSEVGNLFFRLAESREVKALQAGKSEFLRGFAMATALNELMPALSEEQCAQVHETIARELARHGLE